MSGPVLGREPVASVSTAVALLIALLPLFGWSTETVGLVAAALVAVGGGVEAALVSVDRLLPLLVGIGKAVIAAAIGLGLDVPDNWVAAFMAVLTVLAGLQIRKQVGAVQPPTDRDGREVDVNGWPVGALDPVRAEQVRVSEYDPGVDPQARGDSHTEVFGAVAADGPLPSAESAEREREHQPRHGQPYSSWQGRLDPGFG